MTRGLCWLDLNGLTNHLVIFQGVWKQNEQGQHPGDMVTWPLTSSVLLTAAWRSGSKADLACKVGSMRHGRWGERRVEEVQGTGFGLCFWWFRGWVRRMVDLGSEGQGCRRKEKSWRKAKPKPQEEIWEVKTLFPCSHTSNVVHAVAFSIPLYVCKMMLCNTPASPSCTWFLVPMYPPHHLLLRGEDGFPESLIWQKGY